MTEAIAVLIGLGALLVSAIGGWPLTAAVLRWAARSRDAGTDPSPAQPEDDGEPTTAPAVPASKESPATSAAASSPADAATQPAGSATTTPDPERAVLRGGTWIGILERLAVTGTLALGYPEGVAFVIAVKGLGRYPELREHPGLSERFVIGTLASLAWAAALGAAARALVV
ncbi:hypothetical protein [Actinotalea sp. Marseille-Q4924]|uniref:hypothetical protein n=1 Tax=Actinotalea sp. Marseille-Q4924 TaxID=2866571 RepID=UPI001CE3C207|nr:hypothetical protein [Actinotalea sp. Marseille-Q4924]